MSEEENSAEGSSDQSREAYPAYKSPAIACSGDGSYVYIAARTGTAIHVSVSTDYGKT